MPYRSLRQLLLLALCALLTALSLPTAPLRAQEGTSLAPEGVPGEVYYAPFPLAITLDGQLDDWDGVPRVVVTTGTLVPAYPAALTFAAAADGENLYLYLHMLDEKIVAGGQGSNFWNEDSLEFFLNVTGEIDRADYVPGVAQVNLTPKDLNMSPFNPDRVTITGSNGGTTRTRAYMWRTDDGYAMEVAVSLARAPFIFTPQHGAAIGFQVQANGTNTSERDLKLIWSARDKSDGSWRNPGLFGQLVFFEVGSADVPTPLERTDLSLAARDLDWPSLVRTTWRGYKKHNLYCGADCAQAFGLVRDPSADYHAVSEGIGYGMLMAVMLDDQAAFNDIYEGAERILRDASTGLYNWRADKEGALTGLSAATDADQDIAIALIFAEQRVQDGAWRQHFTLPYGARAHELIDRLYDLTVHAGRYTVPGDQWEGQGVEITNPSYFSPAWYRLYDAFQGTTRWRPVLEQTYASLFANEGAPFGLAPDWMRADGGPSLSFCARIDRAAKDCKYEQTFDGIRVPWRIATDCLWFGEPRACQWSKRTAAFLNRLENPAFDARFFNMQGQPTVSYQNELMTGMWLTAAIAAEDEALINTLTARLAELSAFAGREDGAFWGAVETDKTLYFNQSLAWFGAAMLSGDWRNLYAR